MASSFSRKIIEVKITLRDGEFADGGNTKTITGLPIRVRVEKNGPPDFCKANVDIRGMKYEDMDKLSTLAFKPQAIAKNIIAIHAGNEEDGTSLVFQGEIESASADFNAAPDVSFSIEAKAGIHGMATAKGPTAVKGNQSCATFVEMQAKEIGYGFENQGVTAQLSNAVFNGSPVQQMRAAANQVGAELLIDDGVVKLIPAGGSGKTGNAVLLNKDSGLFGYPVITSDGLDLTALYNPDFELGGYVKVESIVPGAQGLWRIAKLTHDLSAFDPQGGPWESQLSVVEVSSEASKNPEDKSQVSGNSIGGNSGLLPGMGWQLFPGMKPGQTFEAWKEETRENTCLAARNVESGEMAKKFCTIFCLPEIAAEIAEKQSNDKDRQGWLHLHDFLSRWLDGRANNDFMKCVTPSPITWEWVFSYDRVQEAYYNFVQYEDETTRDFIKNDKAKDKLCEILKKHNKFTDRKEHFDFIDMPWRERVNNTFAKTWVSGKHIGVDGLVAALRGFSIYAVAKGFVEPVNGNHYRVTMQNVAVFAIDGFQFDEGSGIRESLGYWSCSKKDFFSILPVDIVDSEYCEITKEDFRKFRERFNIGVDFVVLSDLHEVEEFNGECYDYFL